MVGGIGDAGRVLAGLNALYRAHFELVACRRSQVVQHHMQISCHGWQRLSERLNSLVCVMYSMQVSTISFKTIY